MTCFDDFSSLRYIRFFQGVIIFHDAFDDDHEGGGAQIRVEGVYIWPFRQLRMVANRYLYILYLDLYSEIFLALIFLPSSTI